MNSEGDASSPSPKPKAAPPDYLLSFGIGLVAALVLSPVRRLVIAWTYTDGYYTDYPILIVFFGLGIGAAMLIIGGVRSNVLMGILAGLVVLSGLAISDYLVAHYLINQALLKQGLSPIPVVLPPDVMLSILLDFVRGQPDQLNWWFGSAGSAALLNVIPDPVSVERWIADRKQHLLFLFSRGRSGIHDVPVETYELGSPLHEHSTVLVRLGWPIAVFAVLGIRILAVEYTQFKLHGFETLLSHIHLSIIGLGLLGLAVARLTVLLGNFNNRIVTFEKGFLITQRKQMHIFRWEDIEKLYHKKITYKLEFLTVYRAHNGQIRRNAHN